MRLAEIALLPICGVVTFTVAVHSRPAVRAERPSALTTGVPPAGPAEQTGAASRRAIPHLVEAPDRVPAVSDLDTLSPLERAVLSQVGRQRMSMQGLLQRVDRRLITLATR